AVPDTRPATTTTGAHAPPRRAAAVSRTRQHGHPALQPRRGDTRAAAADGARIRFRAHPTGYDESLRTGHPGLHHHGDTGHAVGQPRFRTPAADYSRARTRRR